MSEVSMSKDDDIGYGRPPKKSQFKKGQSGNPKGRPKNKAAETDDLDLLLDSPAKIRVGGKLEKTTNLGLMRASILKRAMEGDLKAAQYIEKLDIQRRYRKIEEAERRRLDERERVRDEEIAKLFADYEFSASGLEDGEDDENARIADIQDGQAWLRRRNRGEPTEE